MGDQTLTSARHGAYMIAGSRTREWIFIRSLAGSIPHFADYRTFGLAARFKAIGDCWLLAFAQRSKPHL